MNITVNGKDTECRDAISAAALIDELQLTGKRVAVEVNGEIIPRSQHAKHIINADDRVEIVHAIGGG